MRAGGRPLARALALVAALWLATLAGCGGARPGRPLALGPIQRLPAASASRVAVIVMENAESSEVLGSGAAPFLDSLARRYALASASYAITHPSLPNYLALTSGTTAGIESDCTGCRVRARNIVDQLEAAGISWKAYLEGVPRPCFTGAGAGAYAKKHNPFIYYVDVAASRARCQKLVSFGALAADLRAGTLPSFAWITPNLCDDGHDCGVGTADRFLARTVPALVRELGPHGFLVLTWDEGSSDRGCCRGVARGGRIATLVVGPDVKPAGRQRTPVDHYGVLASIESAFALPALGGAADPGSGSLTVLFRVPPRLR